jgi:hypothetical protein
MSLADIRPALRTFLLADSALSAAVGGARIYPGQLPQGQRLASIVYNEISDIGDHTMQGASGLARPRFQIDAWAKTADAASALALLVKERMDGASGVWGSVKVQGAFFDTGRDVYDADAELYGKSRDYVIFFEER